MVGILLRYCLLWGIAFSSWGAPLVGVEELELRPTEPKYVFDFVHTLYLVNNKINFKFSNNKLKGKLYFGFFPYGSNPIIFKHAVKIAKGCAVIDLTRIYKIPYHVRANSPIDRIFYRIIDQRGKILYESRLGIKKSKDDKFKRVPIVTMGPFVTQLTDHSIGIKFSTDLSVHTEVKLIGSSSLQITNGYDHEVVFNHLKPNHRYRYQIKFTTHKFTGSLKTFPRQTKNATFKFGFISDSRKGFGGGEREYLGTNYYVMQRVAAVSNFLQLPFLLFIGDMVSGYENSVDRMNLEYWNWKHSVENYGQSHSIFTTLGNHEVMFDAYKTDNPHRDIRLPKKNILASSEAVFANNFMLPSNGPISEDNSWADDDLHRINFPSYKENVYSFIYGNSAFVVLNSNYWFAPHFRDIKRFGGNAHGYLMDNQLKWFKNQLDQLSRNRKIRHIFIALHTPIFPNGGHAKNDMWYKGNNKVRPFAHGVPAKYGIIERRDQLLKIIDQHKKVLAVLTGDEHNYSLLKITPQMQIYPTDYQGKKIKLKRSFWQITNGTAGAPYYGRERLPWSRGVKEFSSSHLLSVFKVRGKHVVLESINPLTLKSYSTIRLK